MSVETAPAAVEQKPAKTAKPKAKAKPVKKDAPARKGTFNEVMKTRLADGSLRKVHLAVLKGISKSDAIPLAKIPDKAKVGMRSVSPAIAFLCEEGLAKETVVEDQGKTYAITSSGRKALEKATAA